MRYIIIGDIHGCADELQDLLNQVSLEPQDEVISIGDIIHKGPAPLSAIRILMRAKHYILGNHEEKQFRWEKHEMNRVETQKPNPMGNVEGYEMIPPSEGEWLRKNARLYHRLSVGEKSYLLIHGGVEPRMRQLPSTNIVDGLPKKEKYRAMNLIRTRYVNPEGNMVSLGEETSEDVYWAETYDGRFGHAIFGHQPFVSEIPMKYSNATGIDLGCVYGGYLCAFIIDGETGEESFVTVKARQKYSESLH